MLHATPLVDSMWISEGAGSLLWPNGRISVNLLASVAQTGLTQMAASCSSSTQSTTAY